MGSPKPQLSLVAPVFRLDKLARRCTCDVVRCKSVRNWSLGVNRSCGSGCLRPGLPWEWRSCRPRSGESSGTPSRYDFHTLILSQRTLPREAAIYEASTYLCQISVELLHTLKNTCDVTICYSDTLRLISRCSVRCSAPPFSATHSFKMVLK